MWDDDSPWHSSVLLPLFDPLLDPASAPEGSKLIIKNNLFHIAVDPLEPHYYICQDKTNAIWQK